jgi:ribosome-associated toxin RatA of RatAB toxin-antitoxin module
MTTIDFSINLTSQKQKLIELATDYTEFPKYLPDQIKSVKILEKTETYTITEETLHLSTVISKSFTQQTKHYVLVDNLLKSEILSGPVKGSTIEAEYLEIENGTNVITRINVKLGLKYKFLLPLIKKSYKTFLTGILYKMHSIAIASD